MINQLKSKRFLDDLLIQLFNYLGNDESLDDGSHVILRSNSTQAACVTRLSSSLSSVSPFPNRPPAIRTNSSSSSLSTSAKDEKKERKISAVSNTKFIQSFICLIHLIERLIRKSKNNNHA